MKRIGKVLLGIILATSFLYYFHSQNQRLPFLETPQEDTVTVFEKEVENGSGSVVFDASQQFKKYKSIYKLLNVAYYDEEEIDIEEMQENALKGFVDALGDPYTVYLTPDENQIFDEGMQGSQNFEGIGAVVTKKDDGILVESVLKGSPAFKAGIKPLDLIVEIEDTSTDDLGLHEGVELIRGEKGTDVTLTIYREDAEDGMSIKEITVTRDTINVPSVEGELIEQGGERLLHINISVFGEDTIVMFERILKEYDLSQINGVILDLRGNGGGYLPTAVELASYFLPKNTLVTTAKYSIFDNETYKSRGYGLLQGVPTVVLVDSLSASASEIIAAALRERGDATIVGQTTFGKGSIQTLHQNDDGSSLKYTIGKWYTPDGDNIDQVGVQPDIVVEFDLQAFNADVENDNQLEAAVEYLVGDDEE